MKTTIEINDALLQRAKQFAVQRNVSFKAIVEAALRGYLDEATQASRPAFKLRKSPLAAAGCSREPTGMTGR